jgi:hypothetical protein
MNDANRDLLVLANSSHLSQSEWDRQVALLNTLLFDTENWESFSIANEIIDINHRRIIQKTHLIQKILTEKKLKPFVFTCNKN